MDRHPFAYRFDVDDGPKSIEDSKALLREAYNQRVRMIVSTSLSSKRNV